MKISPHNGEHRKKRVREQKLWYQISLTNIMASWHSQMKDIELPKLQIPTFVHMGRSFWSMVEARRLLDTG